MIEVTLTRDEMLFAGHGGFIRQLDALLKARPSRFDRGDPWQHHILGAMAEAAVAKEFDHYWTPCYDDPTGVVDVGRRWQVRSTADPNGDLKVRDYDRDDHAFVFVTVALPAFHLHGWIWGRDAKREDWVRFKNPRAFVVPRAALRAFSSEAQAA